MKRKLVRAAGWREGCIWVVGDGTAVAGHVSEELLHIVHFVCGHLAQGEGGRGERTFASDRSTSVGQSGHDVCDFRSGCHREGSASSASGLEHGSDVLSVTLCLGFRGAFEHVRESWDGDGGENADDGDDDEQFNQAESTFGLLTGETILECYFHYFLVLVFVFYARHYGEMLEP